MSTKGILISGAVSLVAVAAIAATTLSLGAATSLYRSLDRAGLTA